MKHYIHTDTMRQTVHGQQQAYSYCGVLVNLPEEEALYSTATCPKCLAKAAEDEEEVRRLQGGNTP